MKPVVMHLIDSFRQGGSESQALNLYLEMKRSGRVGVELACLDRTGPLLSELPPWEQGRVPEFKLTSFHDLRMAREVFKFVRLLRDRQVDVIHTHDFYTNIFGMLGATLAGVPVRVASRREAAKRPRVKRFLERLAYRLASAVVANCDRVRRDLIAEGVPSTKIFTLYNGVAIEPAELSSMQRESRPPGRGLVTIVANLRPVKDHVTFLRAAQRVVDTCREATFVLAGEGDLEESLRNTASELGIARSVHFIGRCDDVPGLLERSDVCVLSSRSEGFPNAVLEYMAAARPVVATSVGGISEAISNGYNGFLVDPGNEVEMAERIVQLLENPGIAAEMGRRNREIAADRFSRQRQLSMAERLYCGLLAPSLAISVEPDLGVSEVRGLVPEVTTRARNTRSLE